MSYTQRINLFLPSVIKAKLDLIAEHYDVPTKALLLECLEQGIAGLDHVIKDSLLKDVREWKKRHMEDPRE